MRRAYRLFQIALALRRPLGLFYWGAVWTLVAWCEQRDDHRSFRLDRMANPEVLVEPFILQAGQTLQDFLDKIGAQPRSA
jgi:predicted DNA-binding transcriptional regulator YafY